MSSDLIVFLVAIASDLALLGITVFFIITLSDLECDYINARACCAKLNKFVWPELIIRTLPALGFLVGEHWIVLLLNAPFYFLYVLRIVRKPTNYVSFFDPAEILNRGELKRYMRDAMIKLGEHLLFFFVYLYLLVTSLIS